MLQNTTKSKKVKDVNLGKPKYKYQFSTKSCLKKKNLRNKK